MPPFTVITGRRPSLPSMVTPTAGWDDWVDEFGREQVAKYTDALAEKAL